jgi:NAD(P) transhydrogenase subunit alpha
MDVITLLTVFVLATFVGFELITKVPPTLHTPLMSGANAISGLSDVLGCLALVAATINVVGGFLVTDRMMAMFTGKK